MHVLFWTRLHSSSIDAPTYESIVMTNMCTNVIAARARYCEPHIKTAAAFVSVGLRISRCGLLSRSGGMPHRFFGLALARSLQFIPVSVLEKEPIKTTQDFVSVPTFSLEWHDIWSCHNMLSHHAVSIDTAMCCGNIRGRPYTMKFIVTIHEDHRAKLSTTSTTAFRPLFEWSLRTLIL